ncbi:MAG: hypothetical protein ISR69_14240 [Gammaproteobacteria bacterium]|nr:hypothetical protein [Gammaproteobacteria bacterium]
MINIEINNAELEQCIKKEFGNDTQSLANTFSDFIKDRQIKNDIHISIQQIENGQSIGIKSAIADIRSKYE